LLINLSNKIKKIAIDSDFIRRFNLYIFNSNIKYCETLRDVLVNSKQAKINIL
jgi:hypothetical protein